ncbi:hypothetical protein [Mesorhizobium sp. M0207]|uniref:hypothetical protein n=1 Tax=Mesorhizobium sp. M0207 TaxID=2956915 RepID=UPI00333A5F3E
MIGKQFSLFLSYRDENIFNDWLCNVVENIVFINSSFKEGDILILGKPIRGGVRSFKNRRVLVSSEEFLSDLVIEHDSGEKLAKVNSRSSPVIEYDINLLDGDVMLPGRMYYNLDLIQENRRKTYEAYFSLIFRSSKSRLNKVKNRYGSIIYLGDEMLVEFENKTMDFRLL